MIYGRSKSFTRKVKAMRPAIRIKDTIDRLASHSGIVHVGTLLEKTDLKSRLDNFDGVHFEQRQFSHSDVLFSIIMGEVAPMYHS
jgi:hypothetical protein